MTRQRHALGTSVLLLSAHLCIVANARHGLSIGSLGYGTASLLPSYTRDNRSPPSAISGQSHKEVSMLPRSRFWRPIRVIYLQTSIFLSHFHQLIPGGINQRGRHARMQQSAAAGQCNVREEAS
ncbi:hypothetical protein GGR57DRAFT_1971 [Xylariaceae sp. FL1272]|nr:hypothetical protein GGR57DRAFT_1971 [Xylariaceae sp. FL1272]